MPVKLDKDGWPIELIVPSVREFIQRTWYEAGDAALDLVDKGEEEDEAIRKVASDYHCGTQCCLVGWMGVAFDGPMEPAHVSSHLHEPVRALSSAQRKFAEEFLRSAGETVEEGTRDYHLLIQCSNVFEDVHQNAGGFAREHWIAAGEACGYDLSAFKKKERKR